MTFDFDEYLRKFNPNREQCRALLNADIPPQKDRVNFEIACLLSGIKNIFYAKYYILRKIDQKLKFYFKEKNIKKIIFNRLFFGANYEDKVIVSQNLSSQKFVILYNPEREINALLLYLWFLLINLKEINQPGSWFEYNNPYLIGRLLEYEKKDIEFYYMVDGFKFYLKNIKHKKIKNIEKKHFLLWSNKQKKEFRQYIKFNWIKSEHYIILKRDKKEANHWLNKYNKYTKENLNIKIKKLDTKINKLLS